MTRGVSPPGAPPTSPSTVTSTARDNCSIHNRLTYEHTNHAAANAAITAAEAPKASTEFRDFLVRNPATFNKMLHNARPDTIEIQDIVGYHIFLQRKVGEYVDAMMETETEDGRG